MTSQNSAEDDSPESVFPAPLVESAKPASGRRGILADDLTGALDVAAQYAAVGFPVIVVIDQQRLERYSSSIVVVATNSRNDPPETASLKVRCAVEAFKRHAIKLVYKKIDSTCKGNIVSEIDAIRGMTGGLIALCPANPTQGRVVRDGQLVVGENERRDLAALLHAQGCQRMARLGLPLSIDRWERAIHAGEPLVLADAESATDLDCLAELASISPEPVLLVGSASLARSCAQWLARREIPSNIGLASSQKTAHTTSDRDSGRERVRPCLLFIGSNNPVTIRQVSVLLNADETDVCECGAAGAASARSAIDRGRHVVVRVPVHREPDTLIQQSIGYFVDAIRGSRVGSIVLSGGDTASLVCQLLKPQAIEVLGELLPGLALGKFVAGVADGISVCTKPGGFGAPDGLLRAVSHLASSSLPPRDRAHA